MAYTISVRVINNTRSTISVCEQTCYKTGGDYNYWSKKEDDLVLNMPGSGTSGMLRYRFSDGDTFSVALGVHNYKRWCDLDVVSEPNRVLMGIHPMYYGGERGRHLWAQAARAMKFTQSGKRVELWYDPEEGHELRCFLRISEWMDARLASSLAGPTVGYSETMTAPPPKPKEEPVTTQPTRSNELSPTHIPTSPKQPASRPMSPESEATRISRPVTPNEALLSRPVTPNEAIEGAAKPMSPNSSEVNITEKPKETTASANMIKPTSENYMETATIDKKPEAQSPAPASTSLGETM